MSSGEMVINNDVFQSYLEEEEEISLTELNNRRSSVVPRQISLSEGGATFGEILLVIFPYLIIIFDIFFFFVLRGFQFRTFDRPISSN